MTQKKYQTVLYLGAGCGHSYDTLAAVSERLVLVEAQAELAKALRKEAQRLDNAEVIEGAVAAVAEIRRFKSYNLPWAGGFEIPDPVIQAYPNLRLLASYPMETTPLGDLLQEAKVPLDASTLIIIDLPGLEREILEALINLQQVPLPDLLLVQVKQGLLGDGAFEYQGVDELLSRYGFAEEKKVRIQVPRLPWQEAVLYQQDAQRLEIIELKARLAQRDEEIEELKRTISAAEEENARLEKVADADKRAKEEALERLRLFERTQDENNKARAQIETQFQELERKLQLIEPELLEVRKENAALKQRSEQLNGEKATLTQELEGTQQRLSELEKAQAELSEQRDQLVATRDQLAEEVQQLREQLEAKTAAAGELENQRKQLAQQRDDLANERDQLKQQLTGQQNARKELEQQRDQLVAERDRLSGEIQQLRKDMEERDRQKSSLEEERNKLAQERDELIKINQELGYRQSLFDNEIGKAEAQFTLLKDILLRG